jgi:hypothetical protein
MQVDCMVAGQIVFTAGGTSNEQGLTLNMTLPDSSILILSNAVYIMRGVISV